MAHPDALDEIVQFTERPNAARVRLSDEYVQKPLETAPENPGSKAIHRGIHDPTGAVQVKPYAQGLKQDTNAQFVNRIDYDCAVGPHLEWSIAGGTILGKSLVKGWVLGKAGESLGPVARLAGYATGATVGLVTGLYTAYETAELLENSCKANAFEERLRQTGSGANTSDTPGLDLITQTYPIERGMPSVRSVVDYSREQLPFLRSQAAVDWQANLANKVAAQAKLDDNAYISWAHGQSAWSLQSVIKRDLGFMAAGAAGGLFTAHKLHLGLPGKVVVGAGGALFALGLSHLGIAADQDTKLAELLQARLLSKPNDRPNP